MPKNQNTASNTGGMATFVEGSAFRVLSSDKHEFSYPDNRGHRIAKLMGRYRYEIVPGTDGSPLILIDSFGHIPVLLGMQERLPIQLKRTGLPLG